MPVIPLSCPSLVPIQPSMVGRTQITFPVSASIAVTVPTTPNSLPAMPTSTLPFAMMGECVIDTPAA